MGKQNLKGRCVEWKDRGRRSNRKKYLKVMGVHWIAEPKINEPSNPCELIRGNAMKERRSSEKAGLQQICAIDGWQGK